MTEPKKVPSLNEQLGWKRVPKVSENLPEFELDHEEILYTKSPWIRPRANLRQRLRYLITGRQ